MSMREDLYNAVTILWYVHRDFREVYVNVIKVIAQIEYMTVLKLT
jgi:hypothetical protein